MCLQPTVEHIDEKSVSAEKVRVQKAFDREPDVAQTA